MKTLRDRHDQPMRQGDRVRDLAEIEGTVHSESKLLDVVVEFDGGGYGSYWAAQLEVVPRG